MTRRPLFYLITLIATSLFIFLQVRDPGLIRDHIESKTYDLRLHLRNRLLGQPPPPPDIVIVSVDEKSIREIGRWPWRRDVQGLLVGGVAAGKPRVIGVDIMYTEPESKETDEALAAALSRAGNVVLATPFFLRAEDKARGEAAGTADLLWDSAFMQVKSVAGIKWKDHATKTESVNTPLAELTKVAVLGHAFARMDRDGCIRWEALYLLYGDDCYPHFSLQIARIARGLEMKDLVLYGGSGIGLGDHFIPTDIDGKVLINYIGREGSFTYISASDVIKGRAEPGRFNDKVVLIGTSALGTHDQKVTPYSADMPGVEKNATVVRNILLNNFLRPSPSIIEICVLVLSGLFFGVFLPRLRAIPSAAMAAGFIVSYVVLSCLLLFYRGLVINIIYPVANMASIYAVQTVMRFVFEERRARELRRIFSSYVSPKIVRELIEHPEKVGLGGERRVVTVLFTDVIGFTTLSEKRQPEEVVALLNEYFTVMTDIIFKWDGTLDKFVGDEIMVFWGAPVDQPDHAERAVRCALDMSDRLDELRESWRQRGVEGLDCGMGINTGEVIIGNIGAQGKKMDYTVIGDHINLGARVEKLTRQYGSRLLITEHTFRAVAPSIEAGRFGHCEVVDIAAVTVKGRGKEVRVYSLKGIAHNKRKPPV